MNQFVQRLFQIAIKEERKIIGLMSGTSLDGLDIALCGIKGSGRDTEIRLIEFTTIPFDQAFKEKVKAVFSKRNVDLELVCLLNPWIAEQHALMINTALQQWGIANKEIDILASHGQTIYHAPKILHHQSEYGNATLQLGDGDHLAVKTGIITLSDFRQKHIAAGGEGAPLAVYGDYFIFSKSGENRIMLNIGGIANFTYLSADLDVAKIFSTDTGPGNTMMDAYAQKYFQKAYDENAAIAKQGIVNAQLLASLKSDSFFDKSFPKTTGPELFNLDYLQTALEKSGTNSLSHFDVMATLNQFSADTIVTAIKASLDVESQYVVYSSGGGMHNPLLMETIQTQLPACSYFTTKDLDISPDAKEAVLFAILANECIAGGNTPIGGGNKDIPAVSMGKISFPG
ncbi:MAG: anhydro-N-acetylmuramic acid kinase [Sphingobacteriia bacterium]|nr:MAG: anhydro-N-acetylmuramic acid kinase [Sphingobacteriia bacterium]